MRSAILKRADMAEFRAQVNARYQELTAPDNMPELAALGATLTGDLQRLYADAAVGLAWREVGEMPVPLPAAEVLLTHDGFGGPVDRQGHGLQRAFIFTLLQQLARTTHQPNTAGADGEAADAPNAPSTQAVVPGLILAIEEPELYQHPTKQRHLAAVLRMLSEGLLPGADGRTQVAFASHSPMFVSMPHVGEIRFVRRTECDEGEFKQCDLKALDLGAVASKLAIAAGKSPNSFTGASLQARLHILGTELSEGFFADGVVLVEGRSDKAALYAAAARLGETFEGAGIAVLATEGKGNLDRPFLIFRELGIPVYPIWDCDGDKPAKEANSHQNLLLLRAREPASDHKEPPVDTRTEMAYSCFQVNLEATLKFELTPEIYVSCLQEVCAEYGALGSDAQKNPEIMKDLLARAAERGRSSATLEEIVRQIWRFVKGVEIPQVGLAQS